MFRAGDQIIPGFKLDAFLGKGEFGEVWRTESPGGNRLAMKFLDLSEKQGRKEFRAVQRIKSVRHPNLVMTYAMWLLDDSMKVIEDAEFEAMRAENSDPLRGTLVQSPIVDPSARTPRMLVIATALCDQNLMERLKECQSQSLPGIPNDELIGYMSDAAKAIDFLNAPRHDLTQSDRPANDGKKVLSAIHHCDIKPANIMLVGDSAVVGDFGVARVLGSLATTNRSTQLGGSVAYAPPEIFENRSEATSDQYSLAITYYELRAGKLPFEEHSVVQVIRDKSLGKLVFSDVSSSTRKVLAKATSVRPDQRFSSTCEFVDRLAAASGQIRRGVRSRAMRPPSRTWRLAKGLFTLFLFAIAGLWAWQVRDEIEVGIQSVVTRMRMQAPDSETAFKPQSVNTKEPVEEALAAISDQPQPSQPLIAELNASKTSHDLLDIERQTESIVKEPSDENRTMLAPSPEKQVETRAEVPIPPEATNTLGKMPPVEQATETIVEPIAKSPVSMTKPSTQRELPEVGLARQAFEIVDQAVVTESSISEASQLLSTAIRLGYKIEPIQSIGTDMSSLPIGSKYSNASFNPDGSGFIKGAGKKLVYQSFDPAIAPIAIEIKNIEQPIVRVAWGSDFCLLLDQLNQIWMLATSDIAMDGNDSTKATSIMAERLVPNNQATWAESSSIDPSFILVRKSLDRENRSTNTSEFFASLSQRIVDGQLQSCNGMESLTIRSWPPVLKTNQSQSMIFVADQTTTTQVAFHLFNASTNETLPLADTALNQLSTIEQAEFIQEGTGLLVRGRHAQEAIDRVYWLRVVELSKPEVRELRSDLGTPSLLMSDEATGFVSLFDQACTQTIRAENQWIERDVAPSIKSIYANVEDQPFSTSTIQCMVVAPNRWLVMATNRSTLIMAKLFDEERVEDQYHSQPFVCMEVPWQSNDSSLEHLNVVGNYLVSTSKNNVSIWYNFNRLSAIVEAFLLRK